MLIILFGLGKEGASKVVSIHLYRWHHVFKIRHDFTSWHPSAAGLLVPYKVYDICFTSITSVTCEFLTSKKIECNFSHPSKLNVISHIQANFCYNMVVVVLLLSNQLHNIPSYSKVLFKAQILLVHLLYTTIYTHMRHWPNHTLISPNPTNQIRALEHTSELHNIPV